MLACLSVEIGNREVFLKKYTDTMTAFGFKAKAKLSDEIYNVEFCSSLFWPTTRGTVLGPKPGKLLPKMGFTCAKLSKQDVRGTILGYQHLANHVPLIRTYCDNMLSKIDATTRLNKNVVKHNMYLRPDGPSGATEATWEFFYSRYRIDGKVLERKLSEILARATLSSAIRFDELKLLMDLDN